MWDKLSSAVTWDILLPAFVLAFLFFLLLVILVKAQSRPDFDAANFLRDENGKESALRAFAFVALAISSWIMAVLTFRDKITPDYLLYYLLTWANTLVLVKLADKWTGVMPFSKPPDNP